MLAHETFFKAALWLYAVLYLTSVPTVVLVCYAVWALAKRRGLGRKGVLLLVNALLSPLIFAGLYVLIARLFHVDLEASQAIERTLRLNDAEARLGLDPSLRNSVLAFMVLGGFYLVAIAIPTEAVALCYGLVSSVLLLRSGENSRAWAPFAAALAASLALAVAAFFLKTAIFNWAKHLVLARVG